MSFNKFRLMDLMVLGFLAVLAEVLGIYGSSLIFDAESPLSFVFTLSMPLVLVLMMRWKTYSFYVMAIVGVASFLSMQNLTLETFMINGLGYMGAALAYIWILFPPKETIREDWILTSLYYLTGFIGLALFQSIIALIFGYNFLNIFLMLLIRRYLLSIFVGWVLMMIIRLQQSTMIDMKSYLIRLHKGETNDDE